MIFSLCTGFLLFTNQQNAQTAQKDIVIAEQLKSMINRRVFLIGKITLRINQSEISTYGLRHGRGCDPFVGDQNHSPQVCSADLMSLIKFGSLPVTPNLAEDIRQTLRLSDDLSAWPKPIPMSVMRDIFYVENKLNAMLDDLIAKSNDYIKLRQDEDRRLPILQELSAWRYFRVQLKLYLSRICGFYLSVDGKFRLSDDYVKSMHDFVSKLSMSNPKLFDVYSDDAREFDHLVFPETLTPLFRDCTIFDEIVGLQKLKVPSRTE